MQIKIDIEAPALVEALNNLASAISNSNGQALTVINNTPDGAKDVKKDKPKKSEPAPETKTEEKVGDVAEETEATETTDSTPDVDEPTPEELRAKATELSKAGKRDEIKALLDKFGVKNITAIPEGKRAEFMAELEKL